MTDKKVVYEVKVSKPLMIFLWVMGIGILTNLPVSKVVFPEAYAELSNNPTITLILAERPDTGIGSRLQGLDIDD